MSGQSHSGVEFKSRCAMPENWKCVTCEAAIPLDTGKPPLSIVCPYCGATCLGAESNPLAEDPPPFVAEIVEKPTCQPVHSLPRLVKAATAIWLVAGICIFAETLLGFAMTFTRVEWKPVQREEQRNPDRD